jgi:hypothetical protein
MSLREYTWEPGEVGFLEFFFQSARVLKTAITMTANPTHTLFLKMWLLTKRARVKETWQVHPTKKCFVGSTGPEGGEVLDFKTGAEFSIPDPFCVFEVLTRF